MQSNVRQLLVIGAGAATILIALACNSEYPPAPTPGKRASNPVRSEPTTGAALARIQRARANTAWIGQVHSDILSDVTANRQNLIGKGRKHLCTGLIDIVLRHVPQSDAFAGVSRSKAEQRRSAFAAVTQQVAICKGLTESSIFGAPLLKAAVMQEEGGEVSDAFESYANAVAGSVNYSDGTPGSVSATTNAALADAGALPSPDYNAVAAVATLATSSSDYWYSASGGSDGGALCEEVCNPEYQTFIFKKKFWGHLLAVVGVDAWACVAGELSAIHGGHRDEKYLYTECGIWGGAASIGAGMAFMI